MKRFSEKPVGLIHIHDLKTMKGKIVYWVFTIILVLFAIVSLVPTIWIMLSAFKETQEIYGGFSFFPKDMTMHNMSSRVAESWKTLQLGRSIINTFIMSLGSLAFSLVICGLGGYGLSRLKPKGSSVVFALVLWTMMMPVQMRTVPLFISWLSFPFASGNAGVSIIDTYWPIWLAAASNPFNILLFKNSFDAVSISLVEAAKLDGCSNMRVFFKIMIPLSMPVIIFVSIGVLSGAWSEFFIPYLVIQSKELQIMHVRIYQMKTDTTVEMNTYMMGLIFASLPPFIIFSIFQKHIMGGVNIGGVKG